MVQLCYQHEQPKCIFEDVKRKNQKLSRLHTGQVDVRPATTTHPSLLTGFIVQLYIFFLRSKQTINVYCQEQPPPTVCQRKHEVCLLFHFGLSHPVIQCCAFLTLVVHKCHPTPPPVPLTLFLVLQVPVSP